MTDHIAQDRKLVQAEFEEWAHKSPANLAKDAAGGYQSSTVAFAWRAVQAATQRQQDRIAELEAQVQALSLDADRYKFATSHNAEGRLNFKAVYDAWDGDGSFTDQIDAAIAAGKGEVNG